MKTIAVNASGKYDVIIGNDLLAQLGMYISSIHSQCRVVLISDSNVWPIYGAIAEVSLKTAGFEPVHYVFPAGEESKNIHTYLEILNFLVNHKISRSDLLIALGGGVVGDISGFAAATYLRGIEYVQVPTSLLAMVDSSVGGKTAIDLPGGKNLVGAFKQPALVLCDVSALSTLPYQLFLDGCAEIIKYGMLYDADLLKYLLESGPDFDYERVISECITFKRNVVEADEFDNGARQKLNFGHTIGHGVERESNYTISHGQAVAIGMAVTTKAAVHKNLCSESVYRRLIFLLNRFSLPTCTDFSAKQLNLAALSDKKRFGDTVNLIIPRDIGNCDIIAVSILELESFIEAGL